MKSKQLDVVRGTGNVFRDLGHPNPDVQQMKALLAAEIIRMLDREGLTAVSYTHLDVYKRQPLPCGISPRCSSSVTCAPTGFARPFASAGVP